MEQAQISISDPAELYALRDWLGGLPGIEAHLEPSAPAPGELGGVDLLMVLAESVGVLGVAIRSLPKFIRSRRSDKVIVTVTVGETSVHVEAENVVDPAAIIRQAADEAHGRG